MKTIIVLSVVIVSCLAQRPSYAGRFPIGFPYVPPPTTTTPAPAAGIPNRFGESVTTTTMTLPLEALGDVDLVNRLSKLPVDNQPFWFINWKALAENRLNPQTWEQRPNGFIDETSNNVQL